MSYTLGIVGAGTIGGHVARTVHDRPAVDGIRVHDRVPERAGRLAADLDAVEAADLATTCRSDVVVEAASQDAVPEVGKAALAEGATLVVLSVGALADDALVRDLRRLADEHGGRIRVPSGAIAGLDALAGARQAELESAKLTTTKPPASLGLDDVAARRVVFSGSAREAVSELPKNVNVAAALALAGVGFDRTTVEVVVDPDATRNRHRVEVEGAFGTLTAEVANAPSPTNPKTSHLAALAVLGLLERLDARLCVGT